MQRIYRVVAVTCVLYKPDICKKNFNTALTRNLMTTCMQRLNEMRQQKKHHSV